MKSTPIEAHELRYVYCTLIRGYSYDKPSILDNVNHYYQHYIDARRLRTILEKLMKIGLVEKQGGRYKKAKKIPHELDKLLDEPRKGVVLTGDQILETFTKLKGQMVPTPVKGWKRFFNRQKVCQK